MWRAVWTAGLTLALGGCVSGPLQENPLLIRTDRPGGTVENPVYMPQGAMAYAQVYEKVVDVVDDYGEIAYQSRYDGRIETQPTISPGLERPWMPGSPDFYQRLLATLQTIRERIVVQISTADDGGYWVDVKVYKELEDLLSPDRYTPGFATFRMQSTVERQYEVIEPQLFESNWIPVGRDTKLEQVILQRLAHFDLSCPADRLPAQLP